MTIHSQIFEGSRHCICKEDNSLGVYAANDSELLLKNILKLNKISQLPELGMFYGSRKNESDVDVFLIFNNIQVNKNIVYNNLDLSQIEQNDFLFRLSNWDIEYTEPILTGNYFFGNKSLLEKSKEFLGTNKPNKENLDYLNKRSLETYLQAKTIYSIGKNELFNKLINEEENSKNITFKLLCDKDFSFNSIQMLKSLSLLTYSLSYLSASERYNKGGDVIILNKILKEPTTKVENELTNLMNYFKKNNRNNSQMKIYEVDNYFSKTKNLLSEGTY